MLLSYVLNKRYDGTFTMQWIGKEPDIISNTPPHNVIIYKMDAPINGVTSISSFSDQVDGETDKQYVKRLFRYKDDCTGDYTELLPIENISNLSASTCNFQLEIHYYFVYDGNPVKNPPKNIYISNISINGTFEYQETDSVAILTPENNEIILAPTDIYKVFKLENFMVQMQSVGVINLDIKYRFTQNDGLTYTPWEPLTVDNLKSLHLNELRFAKVQYLLSLSGDDGAAVVYDILLIGDFQNVSANSLLTNVYGLKQDCITYIKDNVDSNINTSISNITTNGLSCYSSGLEEIKKLEQYNSENSSGLFNPYKGIDKMIEFAGMLAEQANKFGWTATYILIDPDGNGTDMHLHEHTLKNAVAMKDIKVIVPNNEFKDETMLINHFNLDLFDTFEVHITKQEFKKAFGIQKRPGRDDILYLCPTNKLYYVKHAQAKREVMNASLYYRVILEKYEQRPDIKFEDQSAKEFIDSLTKNTTIDELMGIEMKKDQDKVANKEQTYPTSIDLNRHIISKKVNVVKEKITNGNIDIATNYYKFLNLEKQVAINYSKGDQNLNKGDNRAFISWFKINSDYDPNKSLIRSVFDSYEIKKGKIYNLLNNFDETNKLGYRYWVEKDYTMFEINGTAYELPVKIMTDVWYAVLINLDQRQQKLTLNLYRRNVDIQITFFNKDTYEKIVLITPDELEDAYKIDDDTYTYSNAISDGFQPVVNEELNVKNGSSNDLLLIGTKEYTLTDLYEYSSAVQMQILGSTNFNYTNLRVFNDVVPEKEIQNILNQNIIVDANYLILADNANRKLITTNFWNVNFK